MNNTQYKTELASLSPQELYKQIKHAKRESTILKQLSSEQWQSLLSYLKEKNIPSVDKKIPRLKVNKYVIGSYIVLSNNDNVETIDNTDRCIINDTLDEMRKGRMGYVYYIRYIEILLKYEPDMNVNIDDGVFWCWLRK